MADRSIDYIAKDFDSIVDALISFATVNFGPDTEGNRQWTNFNADDFSRTWLELVAYVGDQIFFYLDVQATQGNLQTATIRSAVLDIAKQFGFVVPTASSSSGIAQFTLSSAGTVPSGFRLQADNGSEFFTTSSTPEAGSTDTVLLLPVIQGQQQEETFSARGVQNEEVVLGFSPIVVDRTNSVTTLRSPIVTVNSNPFEQVDTFINSLPTDPHFRLVIDPEGRAVIRFGDGIFGQKLDPNDTIEISYRIGGGSTGNIAAGTLNSALDDLANLVSVTNLSDFGGGSDEPSLNQLRELIPADLRTLERAVALGDYGDLVEANFSGVLRAGDAINTTDPGVDIDVFVIPAGTTLTNITSNPALSNSITDFLNQRKAVTTVFQLVDANGIDVDVKMTVFLSGGASRAEVTSNIESVLADFFSLQSGDVDGLGTKFGQRVLLNDVYNIVDQIEGIDRFEITKFTYIPRVVATTASGTNYLIPEIDLFEDADTAEWLIAPEENASSPINNPYTVYKKREGEVSNLSKDSLADDTLNFSVVESSTTAVNTDGLNNVIFDSSRSFKVDQFVGGNSGITLTNVSGDTWDHSGAAFAPRVGDRIQQGSDFAFVKSIVDSDTFVLSTGAPSPLSNGAATLIRDEFLVVDSSGNVWTIQENDSHSIVLSSFAINNTIVSDVSSGEYRIVESLIGANIVFKENIFAGIDYNTHNTVYRIGSSFNLIGTIGDTFQISQPQVNTGDFGVPVTIDGFAQSTPTPGTGQVHLAGNPDLSTVTTGVNSNYVLVDSAGQVFEVTGVDNTAKTINIIHQAGATTNPTVSGGSPASLAPRYYSDRGELSLVVGLANQTSGIGFQAIGHITTIDPANIVDGETFTLNDGVNPAVVFEFEKVGGVGGGSVAVDITAAVDADDVRDAIVSAVNGAASLAISASPDGSGLVFLQNDNVGTAGNQTIINGVADSGFITQGMSGGLSSGSVPTPVIPATGKSSRDDGTDSDGNTIDNFVFRTSEFIDDIINLRKSEIPQFDSDNLELDLRGGVV